MKQKLIHLFIYSLIIYIIQNHAIVNAASHTCASSLLSSEETVPTMQTHGLNVCRKDSSMSQHEKKSRKKASDILLTIYYHLNNTGRFPQHTIEGLKPDGSWTKITDVEDVQGGFLATGNKEEPKEFFRQIRPQTEDKTIPGKCWQVISDPSVEFQFLFPIKGCNVHEALQSIYTATPNSIVIECTSAAHLAIFAVLVERFSAEEIQKRLTPAAIQAYTDTDSSNNEFDVLYQLVHYMYGKPLRLKDIETTDIKTGDWLYIPGHPEYCKRHPYGDFPGENVFCVGFNDQGVRSYIGFGKFFQTEPKTRQEIQYHLASAYLESSEIGIPDATDLDTAYTQIKTASDGQYVLRTMKLFE